MRITSVSFWADTLEGSFMIQRLTIPTIKARFRFTEVFGNFAVSALETRRTGALILGTVDGRI